MPQLSRTNLLFYSGPDGQALPVQSVGDWERRRVAIVRAMELVMGPLPGPEKRCPLEPKTESETDCGTYVRRFVTYASEPGGRTPAYLLIPKAALGAGQRAPAVLCLHQTHRLGNKVVVGLGDSPNDEYGVELAQRGYVCLAPAYPLLADYAPDLKGLGYQSGTMKAIWDNVRALDLLESLPFVAPGRFGAIGHSLGGHNAIFTAVFDPRIKVVVSSCGFDSFRDYMDGNISGWTSARYMPRLKDYDAQTTPFDFHELIGALAPRACFVSAPLGDTNFKWRSVDAIAEAASEVYRLYGAPDGLVVRHPDCGHLFPPAIREEAYRILDARLR